MTTIRTIRGLRIALLVIIAVASTACGRDDKSIPAQAAANTESPAHQSLYDASAIVQMTPDQMEQSFSALAAAVEDAPRDAFEPQALAKTIGVNPEALAAWVRDNTYWVPYRGAMRGAAGVLMDRIGNSVDRSLLLAELLRSSGHEVRLAHCEISQPYLPALLAELTSLFPAPEDQRTPEPTVFPEEDIANYASRHHFDAKQLSRTLSDWQAKYVTLTNEMGERIGRQVTFLTQAARPYSTPSNDDLRRMSALRDHWWVQWRHESGWVDLDATLSAEQRSAAQIAAVDTFPFNKPIGVIPLGSENVQEISIRVVTEQWKAGQVKISTVLEHNIRPGELIGQPILFQNSPLNWEADFSLQTDGDPMEAFTDRVLAQKEWLPILIIGDQIVSHYGVDEGGELILDPMSPKRPAGPGGVADALAGSDSFGGDDETPQSENYFTAEWIEYEIRVPGERPSTFRRKVFDLLAENSRTAQQVGDPAPNHNRRLQRNLKLMGSTQILPMVLKFQREFLAYQGIRQNLRNREPLLEIKKKKSEHDVAGILNQVQRYIPTSVRLFDLGLARFEMSKVGSEVYLDSPNILSYRRTLDVNPENQLVEEHGFDIVANSVAVSPNSKKPAFDVRLSQGVADTNAEALLLETVTSNAGSLLDREQSGASWVVIRREEDIDALGSVTTQARALLTKSTRAGNIVIAPRSPSKADDQELSAWQIDPTSGTTIGIDQDGRGAAEEKAIIDIKAALQSAAYVGAITGSAAVDFCMAKKMLQGKLGVTPAADMQVMGDCLCLGLEVGASLAGTTVGAVGGPKGMAAGFAIATSVAKTICK